MGALIQELACPMVARARAAFLTLVNGARAVAGQLIPVTSRPHATQHNESRVFIRGKV